MPLQITIIGLRQIGASIGLALKDKKNEIVRIGNDKNPDIMREAQSIGAIDKSMYNLPSATEKADIIVLAVPPDEIQETLKIICPCMKEGAVLLDTSPLKIPVSNWAAEYLEKDRYFVSITPTLNAAYLNDTTIGIKSAHPDLFKNSMMIITAPSDTHSDAFKLASDFTTLLGATPFFADPYEADGLLAKYEILPQLIAAALIDATVNQPGWTEGQKVAGKNYTQGINPILYMDEEKPLGKLALLNQENTLRVLDTFMGSLSELRSYIADNDEEGLHKFMLTARDGQFTWWVRREKGDWDEKGSNVEVQSTGEILSQLFLGSWGKRRKKEPGK